MRRPTACGAVDMATADAAECGRTLVLAPHPDDETIGCGGLLALLGRAGLPVHVVLISDGAGSHPQSRAYPAPRLRALRWSEMIAALRELGHQPNILSALGLPDGGVPTACDPGFGTAVDMLTRIVKRFRPDTVVMPCRDDAHPDHRAAYALGTAVCRSSAPHARRLEYPVWGGGARHGPVWQLDISAVLDNKRRALSHHRSQQGRIVNDDPQGFVLPQELLERCALPVEIYFDITSEIADGHR